MNTNTQTIIEITKICFKTVMYGKFKDEVIAVIVDSRKNDMIDTFVLFEGHGIASIKFLQDSTRNSTKQEYTTTLNQMQKSLGYDVEIVKSIARVK